MQLRVAERGVAERVAGCAAVAELDDLVAEWLTVPDIAGRLGMPLAEVRRLIEDRELLAVRRGPGNVVSVPAAFVEDDGPIPALRGTFTLLTDARFDDAEIIAWLFTADPSLPGGGGTPLEAMNAGFKTEVRRREMELA